MRRSWERGLSRICFYLVTICTDHIVQSALLRKTKLHLL